MYSSFAPGLLGIQTSFAESIELAARHGFIGVDATATELAALSPAESDRLRTRMAALALRPGYFSLEPVVISAPEEEFQASVESLKRAIPAAKNLGYTRCIAVVMPFSETRAYDDNFAFHASRIVLVGALLNETGISLGLEYVAPLTRRAPYEHHFVHNLKGMLSLLDSAGSPNLGLLLDSLHWYCAGESVEDIAALPKERIVAVHLNDAIARRPRDEQVAFERELPGDSGVIDLAAFVGALKATGYDGPLTAEPMNKALNELPDEEAAARTAAAMRSVSS